MNHFPLFGRKPSFGAFCALALCAATLFSACSPPAAVQEVGQFVGQLESQDNLPAGEMKTLAVVSIGSYQRLLGSVNFLGSLAGLTGADKIVEAQVLQTIQDKGLAAIDKGRPWGVVLQSDGKSFTPLAVLPVGNPEALFAVLEKNGIRANPAADNARELMLPNGISFFAKSQGGVTLVGDSPQAFARVPATLSADLAALATDYDLGARILVQNVPPSAREMIMGWVRGGADAALQQQAGESAEALANRRQAAEAQIKQMEQALDELNQVTIGMKVDTQEKRGYFDVAIEVVPNSSLARQMQAQAEPRTNFAGFRMADSALTFSIVNKLDPTAIKDLKDNRDTLRQQMISAIEGEEQVPADMRDAVKAAAGDFLDAFLATAEDGTFDAAGSVRIAPESLTLIAGARVKDTEKFVSGLKKMEAAAKQRSPSAPGIKWNASQQSGVTFHTLSVPLGQETDEAVRRMVGGELNVAVGIGQDTVYVAAGRDHMTAIQQAIDASKAEPNKLVPQMEVTISLRPLVTLAAAHVAEPDVQLTLQMMAMSLQAGPPGRDHVRMIGSSIPNGQRVRFEAEEGALRAVGQTVFTAVMRAMMQAPPMEP